MPENVALNKLRSGEIVLGLPVLEFATPGIARILQAAGADFVLFDMEHSGFGIETIRSLVSYTRGLSVTPIVRVPTSQGEFIGRVLDAGAQGVMVPMVETAEQARAIVSAAKYTPRGNRGIAYGIAHDDFSRGDPVEKMRVANDTTMVIAMIETALGLENAADIAAEPDVDVLWVGHYDLAASLGTPGRIDSREVVGALEHVARVAQSTGKLAGRGVPDAATALAWIAKGYRALAVSRDISIMRDSVARALGQVRDGLPAPERSGS
jgi:2-keto-3-deoxy-L-rhamnonate aldolase RhmA